MTSPTPPRRWSLRVGTIAGIDIRLHASMLILAWLWVVMAETDPGGLLGAAAWVVTIFVSVLLHELSHSLVARRLRVAVEEIELLPIGGISKMRRLPDSPHDELVIALAGPLASITIGIAMLAATFLLLGEWPPPALAGGGFAARVGWFNLVIGTFNLVPALPLDGGRVLRALFERREGPLQATHHAARIARVLAFGMLAFGLTAGQLSLIVIGLFVHLVSRSEEFTADVHASLGNSHVEEFMVRSPLVVCEDDSVAALTALLTETSQRVFPVVSSGGGYVGMVDMKRLVSAQDSDLISTVVSSVAAARGSTLVEESGLLSGTPALAVVDDANHVVGVVRRDDVLFALQRGLVRQG